MKVFLYTISTVADESCGCQTRSDGKADVKVLSFCEQWVQRIGFNF